MNFVKTLGLRDAVDWLFGACIVYSCCYNSWILNTQISVHIFFWQWGGVAVLTHVIDLHSLLADQWCLQCPVFCMYVHVCASISTSLVAVPETKLRLSMLTLYADTLYNKTIC